MGISRSLCFVPLSFVRANQAFKRKLVWSQWVLKDLRIMFHVYLLLVIIPRFCSEGRGEEGWGRIHFYISSFEILLRLLRSDTRIFFTPQLHEHPLCIFRRRDPNAHSLLQLKGSSKSETLGPTRRPKLCRTLLLPSSLMVACLLGTGLR